jgi:Leucine-rich repeat (LRR) protein
LTELPQALGRMTRLALLNVSDNKLVDLPVSLGNCYGLAKLGAGIQLER